MKWCTVPYSLLAMTKPSEYSDESRLEVRPAHGKYLFVYPFVKTRDWYPLAPTSAGGSCRSTSRSAASIPSVDLNTSYSFGLDDQEFVVAFETDNPADFLDLVQRLRTSESSSYTLRDTPTFTCISCSVERALGALDGVAMSLPAARVSRWCPRPKRESLEQAASALRAADPVLARADRRYGLDGSSDRRRGRPTDHYGALVRAIVGQQLSTKAARRDLRPADRPLRGPHADARGGARRRSRRAARGGRPLAREGRLPAVAGRARARRLAASSNKLGRLPDERGDRRAGRGQGHRPVERAHLPDVPPRSAPTWWRSATSASARR